MVRRFKPGPKLTIGELQRQNGWLWMHCPACRHYPAVTLARYAILLGSDTCSDIMRQRSRCGACGHRGALTVLPSWMGVQHGFATFPISED